MYDPKQKLLYCNAVQMYVNLLMLNFYQKNKIKFLKVSWNRSCFLLKLFSPSSIQAQLDVEAEAMRATQRELLSVEDTVYMPDKDTEPVNRTLIQKAGYLNIRK